MNARTLLALSLLSAAPSLAFAQDLPEPPVAAVAPVPPTPVVPKAPRAATAIEPAIPAAVPVTPQAPELPRSPKPAPAAPAVPAVPAVQAVPPAPPAAPRPMGQMLNVRIDVTLSDSKGAPKVLTMTVADGESGMNRTSTSISSGSKNGDFAFNADASPTLVMNKI